MCTIWLELILPLRIRTCLEKKTRFSVDFFINICLSVRFFVAARGHSFRDISTLYGSNDVISQPLVPFGSHINIAPYQGS